MELNADFGLELPSALMDRHLEAEFFFSRLMTARTMARWTVSVWEPMSRT